ncbi:hypothetical protein LWI28_027459 [Acer negundo]|uniref:Uncharacterized protein n=1 Tax=Acer negundo TaxID=4023 RepID=A0AAD5IB36_ACENE|nr:hypothetical protein LWI28_027459 [Acer negundo]
MRSAPPSEFFILFGGRIPPRPLTVEVYETPLENYIFESSSADFIDDLCDPGDDIQAVIAEELQRNLTPGDEMSVRDVERMMMRRKMTTKAGYQGSSSREASSARKVTRVSAIQHAVDQLATLPGLFKPQPQGHDLHGLAHITTEALDQPVNRRRSMLWNDVNSCRVTEDYCSKWSYCTKTPSQEQQCPKMMSQEQQHTEDEEKKPLLLLLLGVVIM